MILSIVITSGGSARPAAAYALRLLLLAGCVGVSLVAYRIVGQVRLHAECLGCFTNLEGPGSCSPCEWLCWLCWLCC